MWAGWRGGRLDAVIMQAMDMLLAFPSLILGLMLVAVLGPSMPNIIAAIALTSLPTSRLVSRARRRSPSRAAILLKRAAPSAFQTYGSSSAFYILPNIFPEIPVMGALWLANAVRTEASLAFIGLGLKRRRRRPGAA